MLYHTWVFYISLTPEVLASCLSPFFIVSSELLGLGIWRGGGGEWLSVSIICRGASDTVRLHVPILRNNMQAQGMVYKTVGNRSAYRGNRSNRSAPVAKKAGYRSIAVPSKPTLSVYWSVRHCSEIFNSGTGVVDPNTLTRLSRLWLGVSTDDGL